jgi:pyruvate/2-oxoglutarate dehydrogenase complex dihydrolipoamide acyltransferase (E2) component
MKLMNEVKADVDGIVRAIHVENAAPVEFGQLLFDWAVTNRPWTLAMFSACSWRTVGRSRFASNCELVGGGPHYAPADAGTRTSARRPCGVHRAAEAKKATEHAVGWPRRSHRRDASCIGLRVSLGESVSSGVRKENDLVFVGRRRVMARMGQGRSEARTGRCRAPAGSGNGSSGRR